MKPTVSIVQYLYSLRNGWLKHNEECTCDHESLVREVMDQVPVEVYMDFDVLNGSLEGFFKTKTEEEWDSICGPSAQQKMLNDLANQYMQQASELLAVAATEERLRRG